MARGVAAAVMLGAAVAWSHACSLEGFSGGVAAGGHGAGGSVGGGTSIEGGGGGAQAGGAGGEPCGCACGVWSEVRVSDAGPASDPSLSWTNGSWAVAWQDERHGSREIYLARLAPDGSRIGDEVRVTDDPAASEAPALAWSGSRLAVAWQDDRGGGYDVYLALFDPDGVKTSGDVLVFGGDGAPQAPAIGWSSAGFALTWEDYRDYGYKIISGLVGNDAAVLESDNRVTDPPSSMNDMVHCRGSALAWSEAEYGVTWTDTRDGDEETYFARLDPQGFKIGKEVRVTMSPGASGDAAIAWTGGGYLLAWRDERDGNPEIYVAALTDGGVKPDPERRVTEAAGTSRAPSSAFDGDAVALAWQDDRDGDDAIYFRRLAKDGQPQSVERVVVAAHARRPALAWSGQGYGLAWQDRRDGDDAIYFATCTP